MANPYPALITDANSETRVAGQIDFTDPANQPGGSRPAINWAVINVNVPANPLDATNYRYDFAQADLSIAEQAGTDFTIGEHTHGILTTGAVLSAAGGMFQCGAYVGNPASLAVLDGGSTAQRYLKFGAQLGDLIEDIVSLGLDVNLPIVPSGGHVGAIAETVASVPGIASPGGPAAFGLQVSLLNGSGTDSVGLDNTFGFTMFVVWQIG